MKQRFGYDSQAAAKKIAEENNPRIRNMELARVPRAYQQQVNDMVSMLFRARLQR